MIIKNFDQLATSPLRRQALSIAEAGFEAVNTTQAILREFKYDTKKQRLVIQNKKYDLSRYRKIICLGIGKAALEAVTALNEILKDKISAGYVIDLKEGDLGSKIISRAGTHPYPSEENLKYTKELLSLVEGLGKEDLVICVISGGGSALLCCPYEISVEEKADIFKVLTKQGATIRELNTVRKHLSLVKGGQLAKIIYPATCLSLIFSDVPGDDIGMVASGPTVKDSTTSRDAQNILQRYQVLEKVGLPVCKLVETPKEDRYFEKVHNFLLVSAKQALEAMKNKAEDFGFETRIFSNHFQGEARALGRQVIGAAALHQCLLGAGESTVTIIGCGKGGRNQEMALGALSVVADNQVLLCLASDGYDNTEVAGAIVDSSTQSKAKALGLNPEIYLNNNDSFHFFEAMDDLVETGLTGSNAADFFVCLKD